MSPLTVLFRPDPSIHPSLLKYQDSPRLGHEEPFTLSDFCSGRWKSKKTKKDFLSRLKRVPFDFFSDSIFSFWVEGFQRTINVRDSGIDIDSKGKSL